MGSSDGTDIAKWVPPGTHLHPGILKKFLVGESNQVAQTKVKCGDDLTNLKLRPITAGDVHLRPITADIVDARPITAGVVVW